MGAKDGRAQNVALYHELNLTTHVKEVIVVGRGFKVLGSNLTPCSMKGYVILKNGGEWNVIIDNVSPDIHMRQEAALFTDILDEPLYEKVHKNEKEVPTAEDMDDFKAQVNEWVRLDEQIKKLSIAVRERRTQQRAFGTAIQTFMIRFGYDNLSTQHGRITSSVKTVKVPVKQADVRSRLVELKGENEGSELIRQIFEEQRPMVERKSLRRIVPKVNMHLEL